MVLSSRPQSSSSLNKTWRTINKSIAETETNRKQKTHQTRKTEQQQQDTNTQKKKKSFFSQIFIGLKRQLFNADIQYE